MKKIPEKLGRYEAYEDIKTALGNAVYDSLTTEEFESSWQNMVDQYLLYDNEWLQELYRNRHHWVPAYVKDTFWAGMSTTQRSESMNSFFDGYVNSKTTLRLFIEQYENALRDKVEKENIADFHSFKSTVPCITHYDIEKQFQLVYTNSKFQEFQKELTRKMYCYSTFIKREGAIEVYQVTEDIKIGDKRKDIVYGILLNEEEFEVKCYCHHFEFRGILCRHVLCLLTQKKVKEVPLRYILERWKKNIKRKHNFIRCTYSGMEDTPVAKRFDMLCNTFYEVAKAGAISDESCNVLVEAIHNLKIQFSTNSDNSTRDLHVQEGPSWDGKNKTILNPVAVRSRGRPPTLRKENKVDRKSREKMAREKRQKRKKKKTILRYFFFV
ncbi:hypothetical protein PR202_gb00428 [Eleusine coracana subsp. coracana]|uniref:Protein FAR1-RELATED SEQUENCE n=1 Tax=Eleusine coracana subsp. coracana TaxID=191504 RepID=A0AAV5DU21_ELECO|nr:hypothetical protein PR202_gb00428 [Eleusine coracana subsp. coracana]